METLRFLSEQYREAWEKAVSLAGDAPADKLAAMVATDFKPPVCERNKLAVWFAFWGESRSRPTYRKICAARDREYRQHLRKYCEEIIREGNYSSRANFVAFGILAMNEGLWLDLLLNPDELTTDLAREISKSYLRDIFPAHFGE